MSFIMTSTQLHKAVWETEQVTCAKGAMTSWSACNAHQCDEGDTFMLHLAKETSLGTMQVCRKTFG